MIPLPKRHMSRLSQSLACLLGPPAFNVSSEQTVYVYLSKCQRRCSNRRFAFEALDATNRLCASVFLYGRGALCLGEMSSLSSFAVWMAPAHHLARSCMFPSVADVPSLALSCLRHEIARLVYYIFIAGPKWFIFPCRTGKIDVVGPSHTVIR